VSGEVTPRAVPFGRGGLAVTPTGFGSASLGGLFSPMSEEEAQSTLQAAWDAGIRYFDTAPHYGVGLSEERLGRFLASKPRDRYVLSTKVGRLLEPYAGPAAHVQGAEGFFGTPGRVRVRDYSADGVLRSLEESLSRLGLDRVDMLLIHDPDDHERQALDEAYPALERLRGAGAVASIGVGMNQVRVPARFVRETDIDAVLVAGRYTLLDAVAGRELLPLCAERGVDVVAAGVFNSGLLAAPAADAPYDYGPAPGALARRARAIAQVCERHGVPPAGAAIAFARSHRAVRTVLLGMRGAEEVAHNTAAAAGAVPDALWRDLEAEGLLPEMPGVPGAPGVPEGGGPSGGRDE
jgi:D-threo-aldose 1-dehydrogenase